MPAAVSNELSDPATIVSPFLTREEAILLASARTGDSAAFERLIMPHWGALLRMTQRILRNREDAEDAVQTALLEAFRNLNAFHGRARFSSWLTRIALNAALMRLRVSRRKRETSLDDITESDESRPRFQIAETRSNPEQEYLSKERRILLLKGLKRLRPLDVEVLHLRGVQELSSKETARVLELPVKTIKSRLHRARIKLAGHVQSSVAHKWHRRSGNQCM